MSDTLHIVGKPYSPYRAFLGIFVPLPLLKFDGLSEGAKLLFGRLTMYAGKSGKCFPSLESLTAEFFTNPNQSTTTIKRWMGELVKQGFIKRTRRGPGKNAECVFLWHRALEAKSVGIGEEMPDPGSPEIPASKVAEMRPQQQADEPSLDRPKMVHQENAEMDQKRTVDGPKMVPLDRPKMVHAYKEQIDSSLKDSKAAAGFSSPGSSERDQEDAAANPFSDYEDEPKDLCPVVVTSKFDTEQAQAIRKILEAAGIKDRRDDAEKMVAYTKQQNLEPRVMFEFLDWKIKKCQGSKRIETSGFMLRSLQEDLPHYAESFHGRLLKLCLEEDRKAAEVKKIALTPVSLARAQEVLYARFQSVPSIVIERLERKGVFEISPEELLQIGLKVKPCETCKFSGLTGSLLLKTFRFCDCEYGVERCEILGQEYTAKRIADVPSGFKERVVMALEELANPYSAIAIQEGKFQFTENEWDVVISYDPSVARLYPVKDIEAAIAYMGDTRMIKLSNPRCFVCLDTGKYRVHSGEVCCDCPVGFRAREAELELKRAEPKPQAKQAPNSKRMPVTGADVAKILARMERRA